MIALALLILLIATVWAMGAAIERLVQDATVPEGPEGRRRSKLWSNCGCAIIVMFFLVFLFGIALGPIGGQRHYVESAAMQTTRTLALAMFQYANDNNGQYPDGASSTEVFQTLVDGQYISDPTILYVAMPGKVPAEKSAKLKPENVAYDVTGGVDAHSPDTVPIVFLTGFRMDYHAGASAVSLVKPFPMHRDPSNSWFSWSWETFDGLPVAYKSNNAFFRTNFDPSHVGGKFTPDGYGIVPNVIDSGIDLHGQTYRQLTPEGVLK
jgi:hypothetical protein